MQRVNTYDEQKLLLTADKALEEFSGMIYRLARSLSKNNEMEAQEVFQDVFERFLKYGTKKEYDSIEHAKNWFVRVTINCHNALIKRNQKRREIEYDEQIVDMDEIGEESRDYHSLTEAVNELKEKYRIVIHLMYYEGYKISEIAELLEENENTIKTRLARAKKTLRKKLEDDR